MPIYEYRCADHGLFEAMRPMAAYTDSCDCPECGIAADRVLVTAPHLATADRGRIQAHAVNERSADSPKKLSSHGAGCACCSGGARPGRATLRRSDGAKSFPGSRPWMISH